MTAKGKTKEKRTQRNKKVVDSEDGEESGGLFDNLVFKQTKTYELPDGEELELTMRNLSSGEVLELLNNNGDEDRTQLKLMYLSLCEYQDVTEEDIEKMPISLMYRVMKDVLEFNGLEDALEGIDNAGGGEEDKA